MDEFSYKDACFAWSKALCVCFPRRRNNDAQQGIIDNNDYWDRNDEFQSLLQEDDPESLSSILTRSPFSRKSSRKQPRPSVDGMFHEEELQTEDAGMLPDESIQSFTKLVDEQVRQQGSVDVSHDDLFAEEEEARLQEEYIVQLKRSKAHKAALERGLITDEIPPPPPFQEEEFVYPIDKPSTSSPSPPPAPHAPQNTSLFNAPRLNSKQRAAFKRFDADDDSDEEEPAGFAEFFPFAGTHDETIQSKRLHTTRHESASSDESRDDSRSDSGSLIDDDDAAKAAGDLGNGRDRIKSIYKVFTGM